MLLVYIGALLCRKIKQKKAVETCMGYSIVAVACIDERKLAMLTSTLTKSRVVLS